MVEPVKNIKIIIEEWEVIKNEGNKAERI
jgi:hypothetical protein